MYAHKCRTRTRTHTSSHNSPAYAYLCTWESVCDLNTAVLKLIEHIFTFALASLPKADSAGHGPRLWSKKASHNTDLLGCCQFDKVFEHFMMVSHKLESMIYFEVYFRRHTNCGFCCNDSNKKTRTTKLGIEINIMMWFGFNQRAEWNTWIVVKSSHIGRRGNMLNNNKNTYGYVCHHFFIFAHCFRERK